MSTKKAPLHPILPPGVIAKPAKVKLASTPAAGTRKQAEKRKIPYVDSDGEMRETWILHSITYNRWTPGAVKKHKYIVRYSRNALISSPIKLHELANWSGQTGIERKSVPNKYGNFCLPWLSTLVSLGLFLYLNYLKTFHTPLT